MEKYHSAFKSLAFFILLTFVYEVSCAEDKLPAGKSLYVEFCSSCHGIELQGGNAESLADDVWQFGNKRNEITRNIKNGLAHLGMPGYEGILNDSQINQILDYVLESGKTHTDDQSIKLEPLQTLDYMIEVHVFAEGLEVPWGMAFINDRKALVTERPGRLRLIKDGLLQKDPIKSTPKVLNEGQGGLLDVAIDPEYSENSWIYLAYSHVLESHGSNPPGAMTRIVRGRIKNHTWTDEQVVYEAPHETYRTTRHHYGSRIVFDNDGYLYFGIGDRGAQDQAQDLKRPNGKIHRIGRDGSDPKNNPFVNHKDALTTIYCYGNRNPQGLAVHPQTGDIWQTEHGPLGGDELNLIQAGLNYGWPVITYGRNYDGTVISNLEEKKGMTQPIYYWKPSIAVCGMDFYSGNLFKLWKNHLLVTALKYEEVRLLDIKENRVLHDEVLLKNFGRVRDVDCGPDGAIYVVLNDPGRILRLTPLKER